MRPLAFQLLRELSHQRFTSGVVLAQKFGVSRAAVSEALHDAGESGVEIFSLTRRGYRLAAPIELLDIDVLRDALGVTAKRLNLEVVETIASTNTELMSRAADGAPSGTCIAAEMQTAGRGRRGRVWQSAFASSLTFSLLWRFDRGAAHLGGLSLVVGLAVVRALHELGVSREVALKWPNDVLAGHRKLAGVLIESQGDMLGPTAVVIGVGINVRLPTALKESIDQPATDIDTIAGAEISRNTLLAAVLRQLVTALDEFQRDGFARFKAEWIRLHALHDKPVRVLHADGSVVETTVCGVADDGALLVRQHGRELALASGEISLRAVGSEKRTNAK
ncbi:MAG: biotin--[acetyl-CoA-carboxylase] ligase [Betaproteobacteria bacterium]|nr:biotin--[acetyl-CoA-carboxylase] ligase [Betaproteobacteria bacterium]